MVEQLDDAKLGRASLVLASGTIVSRVLGFIKMIALAAVVGVTSSISADAFTLANNLPSNIHYIIVGGVLTAVIVPQMVKALLHKDGGTAFINKVTTIGILFFAILTILVTVLSPFFVWLYAGVGAKDNVIVLQLAVSFAYWCMPQIFFYGIFTLLSEVLNSRNKFVASAWAPALNNVVGILGILLFLVVYGPKIGNSGFAVVWSVPEIALLAGSATAGVAAQALVLILFWRKAGLKYRPDFKWKGVGLGSIGKSAIWAMATLFVTQIAGLFESQVAIIASGKGASVTALNYGWVIFTLPHALITMSIITAYFTRISSHFATNRLDRVTADFESASRIIGLILIAATGAIMLTSFPIARIFMSDLTQVSELAWIIFTYMIMLLPFSLVTVMQRVFYALEQTRLFFFASVSGAIIFILLALACATLPAEWIGVGVVLSLGASMYTQFSVSLLFLRKHLPEFQASKYIGKLLGYVLVLLPALLLSALIYYFGFLKTGFALSSIWAAVLTILITGLILLSGFLTTVALLKLPVYSELKVFVSGMIKRNN